VGPAHPAGNLVQGLPLRRRLYLIAHLVVCCLRHVAPRPHREPAGPQTPGRHAIPFLPIFLSFLSSTGAAVLEAHVPGLRTANLTRLALEECDDLPCLRKCSRARGSCAWTRPQQSFLQRPFPKTVFPFPPQVQRCSGQLCLECAPPSLQRLALEECDDLSLRRGFCWALERQPQTRCGVTTAFAQVRMFI